MKDFSAINEQLRKVGVLPIYCLKNERELETFMTALLPTPIRCIELTARHPFTAEAIRHIKRDYPEFTVGAGTVVTPEILKTMISAGADYFVSPGFDPKMVRLAKRKKVAFLPGCVTPTEILNAKNHGLTTVKFFPCEASGGVSVLTLHASAFPYMSFIPTGGINGENLKAYLSCPNVIACDGNFMIQSELLENGDAKGLCDLITGVLSSLK